jgi:hypothetical protein
MDLLWWTNDLFFIEINLNLNIILKNEKFETFPIKGRKHIDCPYCYCIFKNNLC